MERQLRLELATPTPVTPVTPGVWSWRNASGLTLPASGATSGATLGAPTIIIHREVEERTALGRWRGHLIARAWPSGFDEQEYRLLVCGGRKRRRACPDGQTQDGAPLYRLSGYERQQRERDLNRHALTVYESHNIACNVGRSAMLNYVANTGGLTGVQYFAVGVGSIPTGQNGPQASDTALWAEYYRAAISTASVSGDQVDLSTVFGTGVGNTTYTEAGIFGDGATGTAGSGVLFAHALYAYTKSNTLVLSNDYYVFLD